MQIHFVKAVPLLFVLLWSTGFIAAKYALPFIEPFYLLFIRMTLTVLVFTALCFLFKAGLPKISQALHQLVSGALVHGAYLGGVFAAIKWGMPAGIAALIVGIQPVLTAFLGRFFFGTRLSAVQWLGLVLGLCGITAVLLSTGQQETVNLTWYAVAAAVTALLGISLGTIYQKKFGKNVNLLSGSVFQYISAALLMGLLALSFESRVVVWDIQLLLALTWLIFGLSVCAILLLMYMIREGETAKVASYFYLVPPVAGIEAWILFNEALTLLGITGVIVTVTGVYLVNRPHH
jgi:drug/metabolite transporter (DMT)-like permease